MAIVSGSTMGAPWLRHTVVAAARAASCRRTSGKGVSIRPVRAGARGPTRMLFPSKERMHPTIAPSGAGVAVAGCDRGAMYRPYSMHAAVTVRTLQLDPPLVNGSGVVDAVSADQGWNLPDAQLSKLGAFTTKTITAAPRDGNPQPWADTWGEGTLVNAAGLPNPGIDVAMRDWAVLPGRLGIPVIVSVGGDVARLDDLVERVDAAGWASGIELNLSCPNVDGGLVAGDPHAVASVLARVRAMTSLPIFAKLTPASGAPATVAKAAVDAGADALTCGNTMPIRALAPDGTALLGAGPDGGLSGIALHAINLRLVATVAAVVDVPIVGLGGVDGVAAARRMFDAGATIIGVGTGAVHDPGLVDALAVHLTTSVAST